MSTYAQGRISGPGGSVAYRLDWPRVLSSVGAFQAAFQTEAAGDARLLANTMRSEARTAYTGTRFAGTFGYRVTSQPVALTLFNTHPLFEVVDEPTRPHEIRAKNGPYLHFHGSRGWARVVAVQHPGTQGKKVVAGILDRYRSTWARLMVQAARKAALHVD